MLIGLAATVLLVANGRVAGISGIVDGLFGRELARIVVNAAFVVGCSSARCSSERALTRGRR